MIKVTSIRFHEAGKIYDYEPAPFELKTGDKVIVESGANEDFAFVAYPIRKIEESPAELKHIIRKATPEDEEKYNSLLEKANKQVPYVKKRVKELGLQMNVVNIEYSLDESKMVINFTADERVDFRDLLKELGAHFKKRVELRQIGIRDETKLIGGLGVCGQPCCCRRFLDDFGHVTVKMAKTQNLSLNPTKISGLCGRLMCCLEYENQTYADAQKDLPKLGSEVDTPDGVGTLVGANIIKEQATVKFTKGDDTTLTTYKLCDVSHCKNCPAKCPNKEHQNNVKNNNESKGENNGIQN